MGIVGGDGWRREHVRQGRGVVNLYHEVVQGGIETFCLGVPRPTERKVCRGAGGWHEVTGNRTGRWIRKVSEKCHTY